MSPRTAGATATGTITDLAARPAAPAGAPGPVRVARPRLEQPYCRPRGDDQDQQPHPRAAVLPGNLLCLRNLIASIHTLACALSQPSHRNQRPDRLAGRAVNRELLKLKDDRASPEGYAPGSV